MVMQIVGWAVFGLIAGAIARLLHPGRDPMNWVWTMLLGIGGAELGGWIGRMVGVETSNGMMSWIAAVGGAVLLLVLYHLATASRATTGAPASGAPATGDDYKRAVFDDLRRGPDA